MHHLTSRAPGTTDTRRRSFSSGQNEQKCLRAADDAGHFSAQSVWDHPSGASVAVFVRKIKATYYLHEILCSTWAPCGARNNTRAHLLSEQDVDLAVCACWYSSVVQWLAAQGSSNDWLWSAFFCVRIPVFIFQISRTRKIISMVLVCQPSRDDENSRF